MRYRAVIFDLWDTLADWDPQATEELIEAVAARAALDVDDFRARWHRTAADRYTRPIRDALAALAIPEDALDDVYALRLDHHRRTLVPRPGAVETLTELRARGVRLGMISVCTEEVSRLWPETPFHGLFDAEVFSCDVGLSKPDPRIYRLCLDRLGVEPDEAVFVGDGANDELGGARRVGMDAILIHRPGAEPYWPDLRDWDGPRVTSIPEVLELV